MSVTTMPVAVMLPLLDRVRVKVMAWPGVGVRSKVPQHQGEVDAVRNRCATPEAAGQGVAPAGEHPGIRLADRAAEGVAAAAAEGVPAYHLSIELPAAAR